MIQKEIREHNGKAFEVTEAAEWLKELDDRTKSTDPDYNSIKDLSEKLKVQITGTTNSISKFTDSGTLGDSQIFDNGTSVGIGTDSPRAKLDVTNGSSGQTYNHVSGLLIDVNGTSNSYYGLRVGSNTGNDHLVVTNAGKVGIGTDSPSHNLHVESAGNSEILTQRTSGAGVIIQAQSTTGVVGTRTNHRLDLKTNGTTRVTILTNGNVGIGTTRPTLAKLQVNQATGSVGFNAGTSSSPERGNLYFDTDGTGWKFNIGKLQSGTFSPLMTFEDNGKVGIGINKPSDKLHVAGSVRITGALKDAGNVAGKNGQILSSTGSSLKWIDAHIVDSANASVTSGWITVAQAKTGRRAGEIYVTDGESGDHSFVRIDWMRSYSDSNFTVLNCGGHQNRIQGVRVLQETADPIYGLKYLQVKVTATSKYYVIVTAPGTIPNYSDFTAVTPVLENTKTGYSVTGAQLEDLQNSSVGTDEGITVGGELYVNGTGDSYFTGDVGIGTDKPSEKLDVIGKIRCYSVVQRSDRKFKTNIELIDGEWALSVYKKLKFSFYDFSITNTKQAGLIAQEVEKILPQAVSTTESGEKGLDYNYIDIISKAAIQHFIKTQIK